MNSTIFPPTTPALDDRTAARLAELFSALGDPNRIRILYALKSHARNVGELAELAGISESTASHHLRGLRQMRLVRACRSAQRIMA